MPKRILALLLAMACLFGMGEMMLARAESLLVYVVSNTLPVYQYPDASSRVLGTMAYGEPLLCTAVSGGCAQVRNASGAVGYCAKGGLSTRNPNNLSVNVYITAANTNVYRYPHASSRVMMRLSLNACFRAVAVTPDGRWVRLQNGKHFGFVSMSAVSTAPVQVQTYTKGDVIAAVAAQQLGKPYAYGAEGSARFDCSGFAYYVYKNAVGVKLKRSSADQAADGRFAAVTDFSAIHKGDLLCFNTGGNGVDHVGVYIGGGKFIHASQTAGKVIISDVSSGYYLKHLLGARRIA